MTTQTELGGMKIAAAFTSSQNFPHRDSEPLTSSSKPPLAPLDVTASEGQYADKILVSWGSPIKGYQIFMPLFFSSLSSPAPLPDTLYFQVFRSPTASIEDATQLTDNHPASPYDDRSAEPGVTYHYWVKACNSAGCSDYSSPALGWQAEIIPAPPSGLFATQGGSGAKVDLSWTASEYARYYIVYRNTTNSHEDEQVISEHSTTCSFEDKNVTSGILFYYWVKACNSAGCSDYSSPVSGWIGVIPPPPPTNVSASQGTVRDRIRVSWSASVGASYYRVYRNTTEHLDHVEQLPGEPTISPYDDETAEDTTIYYYWVKACNSAGCSDYSASASGWLTEPIPAAPTGLSASEGTYTDKVSLTWIDSENANYYQIYRNTVDDHTGQVVLEISYPNTTYNDFCASPGVLYYYWIKACNSAGCSKYSESAQGWRAETLPAPPTEVNASDGHYTDKVHLSWTASDGAMFYQIYRHISDNHSDASKLIHNHPTSPYEDKSAVPETIYFYWVKACNSAGCSSYSTPDSGWRALVNIANGDFEAGNDGSWSVFSKRGRPLIVHEDFTPIKPHSGQYLAWLGGENDEISSISQEIFIPNSHSYLHFWYQIHSQDMCQNDYARIRINTTTWMTFDLCTPNNTVDWTFGVLDLSDYIGETVKIEFKVMTDLSYVSSFYLDDITLSSKPSGGINPRMNGIK